MTNKRPIEERTGKAKDKLVTAKDDAVDEARDIKIIHSNSSSHTGGAAVSALLHKK